MSLLKRAARLAAAIGMATLMCLCVSGCGEDVAATWSQGNVTEEAVTSTIENLRAYYGLTSDEDWAKFIKERSYEESETAAMTATELAIANISPEEDTEEKPEGTAQDLREYIIEQMIRSQIIDNEIKSRNIEISDEEVNAYVEQQRAYIESRIMEGVFESVLQRQGYANLDAYKDEIREQLKQLKLQNDVSTITTDDGTEISGKSAWNSWFDDMYAKAEVKINPAPDTLPYEPIEGAGEEAGTGEEAAGAE